MAGPGDDRARRHPAGCADDTTAGGARTPEELATLFEDALLVRDEAAVAALFAAGAVFVAGDEPTICGGAAIARRALARWDGERTYVADPQRVLQARDLALVVTERSVAVMRRGGDDAWRYAIAVVSLDDTTAEES